MSPSSHVVSLVCAVLGASPSPPATVRVMAYNVLYSSPAEDIDKSLEVIEKEAPEVLCLRELTPGFAAAFRKRLGKDYPHLKLMPRKGGWGVGLASRHPLRRVERFPQKPHRMPGLEADVVVGGRTLKVACLHLMPPGASHRQEDSLLEMLRKNATLRKHQAEALVKRYAKERGPVLLFGDMNESRTQEAMTAFAAAGFTHACDGPDALCGDTWPGAASVVPSFVEIDHILGRQLSLSGAKVLHGGGSDHFAVRASVALPP
ncbi:Endonuclease/Exonuclease/phosphatase family protein [Myxococcus fulvus]|uniref:Endonuclease/Exonuclease/phosphatase family protein n=1 Tax=Myxococcus fulvus TaxID=33 RepID=A0A511SVE0_MYXFU|nr:endonuclease/exonuclease/phosphatase family protein [Myxococcus fulvus]GEN05874.1 hypothetical protein MFU01_09110 [Myxococcus fulvus]SET64832.1 Endonuclease/Exonuclease/phosphatase family protein [Myxococcus fulvus]